MTSSWQKQVDTRYIEIKTKADNISLHTVVSNCLSVAPVFFRYVLIDTMERGGLMVNGSGLSGPG